MGVGSTHFHPAAMLSGDSSFTFRMIQTLIQTSTAGSDYVKWLLLLSLLWEKNYVAVRRFCASHRHMVLTEKRCVALTRSHSSSYTDVLPKEL